MGIMPTKIGNLTLYSVEELSSLLSIQERSIRKFLREGRIKGRKLAGRWYVTEENLRAYFEEPEQAEPEEKPKRRSKK